MPLKIVNIEVVDNTNEEEVYDIETEHGTFLAGGITTGIMCKNTDSCYVKFPLINMSNYANINEYMKAIFKIAKECAAGITKEYPKPIELEFEKAMYPYLSQGKKAYAYVEWLTPDKHEEGIELKGLAAVRRNVCEYVREELTKLIDIFMTCFDEEELKKRYTSFVKKSVDDLLFGNINLKTLILSKQLKSSYGVRENNTTIDYHWTNEKINMPHVRVAQNLRMKDPTNSPKPPERVPFLFIETKNKNALQCDRVIHPDQYNEGGYKIDTLYYFKHQYEEPLKTIFEVINVDPSKIYAKSVVHKINEMNGQREITSFFKPGAKPDTASKIVWTKEDLFDNYNENDQ
jgi:DNA polymerase elongation subunit (family B)